MQNRMHCPGRGLVRGSSLTSGAAMGLETGTSRFWSLEGILGDWRMVDGEWRHGVMDRSALAGILLV